MGTDLVARYYAEAYGMTIMTTRMFTHTGPRRGDVFAESTWPNKQWTVLWIIFSDMIEHGIYC